MGRRIRRSIEDGRRIGTVGISRRRIKDKGSTAVDGYRHKAVIHHIGICGHSCKTDVSGGIQFGRILGRGRVIRIVLVRSRDFSIHGGKRCTCAFVECDVCEVCSDGCSGIGAVRYAEYGDIVFRIPGTDTGIGGHFGIKSGDKGDAAFSGSWILRRFSRIDFLLCASCHQQEGAQYAKILFHDRQDIIHRLTLRSSSPLSSTILSTG